MKWKVVKIEKTKRGRPTKEEQILRDKKLLKICKKCSPTFNEICCENCIMYDKTKKALERLKKNEMLFRTK